MPKDRKPLIFSASGPVRRQDPGVTFRQAQAYQQRGQLAQAELLYGQVLADAPKHVDTLVNLGILTLLRGDADGAAGFLRKAVKVDPRHAVAHANLGIALGRLGRPGEALVSFDKCLAERPDLAEAHDGRGSALGELGQLEAAVAAHTRALALQPNLVAALVNRAFVLTDLNRYDEAIRDYHAALALQPDFGRAHFDLSQALLVTGDFARGWEEFEWRFRVEAGEQQVRSFAVPRWTGAEPLEGKTLLLHAEQGMGDTVQFARYAPLLNARGARVVLKVQPPLVSLLTTLDGVAQVIASGEPLPPFDLHCPMLSLPKSFGTDLTSIPARSAYLRADPERVQAWRARLSAVATPTVGLVWAGNVAHRNDRNRSIPLRALAPLMTASARFVSLQKDLPAADVAALRRSESLTDLGRDLNDFADTAALIECLDLVITVDTSVAHVAGALGKPVWILLPFSPDWRWLLDRDDSPWYPTARLYRQPRRDDWSSVIAQVTGDLATKFGTGAAQV